MVIALSGYNFFNKTSPVRLYVGLKGYAPMERFWMSIMRRNLNSFWRAMVSFMARSTALLSMKSPLIG